jgi:hypothetical protein
MGVAWCRRSRVQRQHSNKLEEYQKVLKNLEAYETHLNSCIGRVAAMPDKDEFKSIVQLKARLVLLQKLRVHIHDRVILIQASQGFRPTIEAAIAATRGGAVSAAESTEADQIRELYEQIQEQELDDADLERGLEFTAAVDHPRAVTTTTTGSDEHTRLLLDVHDAPSVPVAKTAGADQTPVPLTQLFQLA